MRREEIEHHLYFAYGHNTNSEEMQDRCPDARLIGRAELRHFKFKIKHFADIVPEDGAVTYGVLWSISNKDLKELDHDEGIHEHYNRIPVQVHFGDRKLHATAYIMDPGYKNGHDPDKKYVELVASGYEEHDIPLEQLTNGID